MKSLTETKQKLAQTTNVILNDKTNTPKREEKQETKAVAQCCAKVSNIVAGCHD